MFVISCRMRILVGNLKCLLRTVRDAGNATRCVSGINLILMRKVEQIYKDLDRLVNYMWLNENKDWEELNNPDDHIFHAINNVRNFLIGRRNGRKEESKLK